MERYSEYKDSGVKWLGEIPSHWEVIPIKRIVKTYAGATPNSNNENYWGGSIPWITPANFKTETKYVKEGGRFLTEQGLYSCSTTLVPANSVIFSKRAPVGQLSITTQPLCTNQGCISCVPIDKVHSIFFFYLLSIYKNTFESFSEGTTFKELSQQAFNNFTLSLPPIEEQIAIADYLDSVTSKIDEAIAQQQKMIDLLNERKQIIINNAVTKGLDPNVKMKPSGVDWIGDIPEHWEVSRIKNVISLLTDYDANGSFSDIASNCNINSGTPYAWMVRTTDLVNNRVGIVDGNNYCDLKTYNYLSKSKLDSGDLLMTKRGNVGMVYVVPECDVPMTLAPNLYLLKTKSEIVDNKYMMFYLRSSKPQGQLALLNKSTTLGALYKDDVKALQIVLPNKKEQIKIAEYIECKCVNIDLMINSTNRKISLLQERKQIIINDVVTGKLKVV